LWADDVAPRTNELMLFLRESRRRGGFPPVLHLEGNVMKLRHRIDTKLTLWWSTPHAGTQTYRRASRTPESPARRVEITSSARPPRDAHVASFMASPPPACRRPWKHVIRIKLDRRALESVNTSAARRPGDAVRFSLLSPARTAPGVGAKSASGPPETTTASAPPCRRVPAQWLRARCGGSERPFLSRSVTISPSTSEVIPICAPGRRCEGACQPQDVDHDGMP